MGAFVIQESQQVKGKPLKGPSQQLSLPTAPIFHPDKPQVVNTLN